MLIIRIKAHLLLIVGNKIVTKKNEEIALYILLSIKVGLVRFGYIDKGIN